MNSIIVNSSKSKAFKICEQILLDLNCDITSSFETSGLIEAKMKGSFFSYGHSIEIEIINTINENIEIIIISYSVGIQIIDWGTNTDNENEILQLIKEALS